MNNINGAIFIYCTVDAVIKKVVGRFVNDKWEFYNSAQVWDYSTVIQIITEKSNKICSGGIIFLQLLIALPHLYPHNLPPIWNVP